MAENTEVVGYTFEEIEEMAAVVLKYIEHRPTIGIICGTGLGGLEKAVDNPTDIPYSKIPGFPQCTVKGHTGKFVYGELGGKQVIMMIGRFHHYEGYPMWKVAMPVRVMKAVGVETLVITNAAGGKNQSFKIGDVMVINDHINLPGLFGFNPLRGQNDERFGPRFMSTNKVYDKELNALFKKVAGDVGMTDDVKEGVYMLNTGPTFASTAEIRIIHSLGADAIGMSTVPEAIIAKHAGIRVFAFSLITDIEYEDESLRVELTHEEVLKAADARSDVLQKLVKRFIAAMYKS